LILFIKGERILRYHVRPLRGRVRQGFSLSTNMRPLRGRHLWRRLPIW